MLKDQGDGDWEGAPIKWKYRQDGAQLNRTIGTGLSLSTGRCTAFNETILARKRVRSL